MLRHAPIAVAILSFIGCGGGSSSKPDAGGAGGGSLGGVGGSGGSVGPGGSIGTGGAAMPTGSKVFQGQQVVLLDLGAPCTSEAGATTDRWCGIIAPSTVTATNAALYVINVTKAAAGTAIDCTAATDPNCIKLSDNFGEDDNHPALFRGDTLVYYDAATGTPSAWRPGMAAGKVIATLTSDADAVCTPSPKGTALSCLRLLPTAMQTDPQNTVLVDVLAGHLENAATPPLAKVDTVIAASSSDMAVSHIQVGFPVPGSETIAWSARSSATGPEVLKMQTMGNDASRATIASGVNSWTVSPDGTRWYWLTNVVETTGVGALQSAPYPAGTGPGALASNVLMYDFPTTSSVALVDTAKNMTLIADPVGAPATTKSLDTGVASFLNLDGKGTLAYVKTILRNSDMTVRATDLFVKKTDGTNTCALTAATDAYPFAFDFTASSSGAAWAQRTITSAAIQFTRLSDCMKMTVGSNTVFFVLTVGDRGVVFLDGLDTTVGVATAKLRTIGTDGTLTTDPATTISGQVGSLALATGTDILVYSVNGGGADDGIYVRSFAP